MFYFQRTLRLFFMCHMCQAYLHQFSILVVKKTKNKNCPRRTPWRSYGNTRGQTRSKANSLFSELVARVKIVSIQMMFSCITLHICIAYWVVSACKELNACSRWYVVWSCKLFSPRVHFTAWFDSLVYLSNNDFFLSFWLPQPSWVFHDANWCASFVSFPLVFENTYLP